MNAVVLRKLREPLIIEEVPIPTVRPNGVLTSVKQCGICTRGVRKVSEVRSTGNLSFIIRA